MVALRAAYLDASALVKLLVEELGSAELRAWLTPGVRIVTSRIGVVEVSRAVRRLRRERGERELDDEASALVATVDLVELDGDLAADASRIASATLRTLDAIHLATAISLRAAVPSFVAYDRRLLTAALENGLEAASPGIDLLGLGVTPAAREAPG